MKTWKFVLLSFVTWEIATFIFLTIATRAIPLQQNFIGGSSERYQLNPYLWAWGNFDGEHYLSIAFRGYSWGEEPFFPLFPMLIRVISNIFGNQLEIFQTTGLILTNLLAFMAFLGLWKLVRLDYANAVSRLSIVLLLIFPTSFYFASFYTESLFLALAVWSFYCARKNDWLFAGILGGLASASRVIGVTLFPALLIEWLIQNRYKEQKSFYQLFFICLIPIGLLVYMIYLWNSTGDPLAFIHRLTVFGEQRSSSPILLPQVFWRYIKMIPEVSLNTPYAFTFLLEWLSAVIFLILSLIAFKGMRLSYAVYSFLAYIIPTFSGSFSSLPRYVLALFPLFILIALLLQKTSRLVKVGIVAVLFILLGVSTSLFVRGFWIA